jgi:hypothetical protein
MFGQYYLVRIGPNPAQAALICFMAALFTIFVILPQFRKTPTQIDQEEVAQEEWRKHQPERDQARLEQIKFCADKRHSTPINIYQGRPGEPGYRMILQGACGWNDLPFKDSAQFLQEELDKVHKLEAEFCAGKPVGTRVNTFQSYKQPDLYVASSDTLDGSIYRIAGFRLCGLK